MATVAVRSVQLSNVALHLLPKATTVPPAYIREGEDCVMQKVAWCLCAEVLKHKAEL